MAELDKRQLINLRKELQEILERYLRYKEDLEIIPIQRWMEAGSIKIHDLKLYLNPQRSREFLELYSIFNPEFQLRDDSLTRSDSGGEIQIRATKAKGRVRFEFLYLGSRISPRAWILEGDRIRDLDSEEISIKEQEFRVYARYQLESGESIHGTARFELEKIPEIEPQMKPGLSLEQILSSAPILDLTKLEIDHDILNQYLRSHPGEYLWIQELNLILFPGNLSIFKLDPDTISKLQHAQDKLLGCGISIFPGNSALVSHGFLKSKLSSYFSNALKLELKDESSVIGLLGSILDSLGESALQIQLREFMQSLEMDPNPLDLSELMDLIKHWRAGPRLSPKLELASQAQAGSLCPYCGDPIEHGAPISICPKCNTPHHLECWNCLGGKCGMLGCGFRP